MQEFMITLKAICPFLESTWCQWLIGIVVFLNPIAIIPQLFIAAKGEKKQIEGISIFTFLLFAAIQLAVASSAIIAIDWKLFSSMAISFLESVAIVLITLKRRRCLSRYINALFGK